LFTMSETNKERQDREDREDREDAARAIRITRLREENLRLRVIQFEQEDRLRVLALAKKLRAKDLSRKDG
jgi:hypothetical protein